jgi:hypothetical protein
MFASITHADDETPSAAMSRPILKSNRWQEDWSVLADPAVPREPLDGLKYIPLSDSDRERYLSLGATLRERIEANDAAAFGTAGSRSDAYLLQRFQVHADLHLGANLRFFTQLEDARACSKAVVSSADENGLDLRLAYAEYDEKTPTGTIKARLGRQDFAFDLQRFVSSRDGPNVRQSFDALWLDWETDDWRFIGFTSRPVQYRDDHSFDDHSNRSLRFDTLRIERHVFGRNELSAYYAVYQRDGARYQDAAGNERRSVVDTRFAGKSADLDWDIEAMRQGGDVGDTAIRAWGAGSRVGYTLDATTWQPRIGLQLDAASGDRRPGDGTVGTFSPLFPNGYYFTLAGYTGYANLIHVKPSLTLKPDGRWTVVTAAGLLWRETTADAVYVQPNVPVATTAGHGSRYTGRYEQLRIDCAVDSHTALALEAVHYEVGAALASAGGHDSNFVGIELKYAW